MNLTDYSYRDALVCGTEMRHVVLETGLGGRLDSTNVIETSGMCDYSPAMITRRPVRAWKR